MKKFLLLTAMAALTLSGAAKGTVWTLQGKTYNVDTLYHAKIGPGTTRTDLKLSGAQNLRVFYTTTDLTDPYVDIRVTKASKKFVGCQKLSAQQQANDRAGARYFAGVNADFFGNSAPIGSTIVDGTVINAVNNSWVNWYMTADKKPGIATLGFNGTATFPGDVTHVVSGLNVARGENGLVVYNKLYNGSTSGTNSYGQEVSIRPVEGDLGFSGKSRYTVTCEPVGAGSMAIPSDGYVLSGHGTAAAVIKTLKVGDEVSLDLNPKLNGVSITQMASGQPVILSDGVTLNTQTALDHLTALNPRTAVGYNADGTRLVLLVVDGRTSTSVGVVSRVLADIMRETGCTEAMNFDGGGSSEMYTSQFGVINHPSDGTERAVTDAAWCVYTGPDDSDIASIAFTSSSVTVPKYGYYTPVIYGYNKYGMLVDTNVQGFTLSAPEALGTTDGSTLCASGSGTHALTATLNGMSATIAVTVGTGKPAMRLQSVITDSYRDYKAEVVAEADGLQMPLDNRALSWTSDNTSIATVDENGVIHGVANGTATVTATVEDNVLTLPVNVEIPATRYLAIDPDRDLSTWSVSKTALSAATVEKVDDNAFNVNYTVSSTRGTKVTVKVAKPMYALPDQIRIIYNPGDAKTTKMTVNAAGNGLRDVTYTIDGASKVNEDNEVIIPIKEFCDDKDFASYPVTFTSFGFYLGDAVRSSHTIRVSALQSVHLNAPETGGVNDIIADPDDSNAPAAYYDINGRRVTSIGHAAPGLYIRVQGSKASKVLVR